MTDRSHFVSDQGMLGLVASPLHPKSPWPHRAGATVLVTTASLPGSGAVMHGSTLEMTPADASASARAGNLWPVEIRLFGGLTILKQGQRVSWRGAPKTEAVLQMLALAGNRVCREELFGQLWPEGEGLLPAQSLHSLLHNLHRLLGDATGGAMPVVHTGEMYRINTEAGVAVDVVAFDALVRQGDRAWNQGHWLAAASSYREAVGLYRGDLHPCTQDVAQVERERLRALYLVALARLADVARRDQDYASALHYASAVLRYDAGREDAHRTLMYCYARMGQRAQALRQYLLCELLLRDLFGAVPESSTRQLYDRLRLDPGGSLDDLQAGCDAASQPAAMRG